jgi:Icc-related predicted phosphoesterase
MKILALSDSVVPYVYSPSVRELFAEATLVAGCGDLPASYLEYVVGQLNIPLVYVPGNHDPDIYRVPGGIDVDGKISRVAGLTIVGLGSQRYKADGRHQYSEAGMHARMVPVLPRMILRRLRTGHGADLLVTHAPPLGIHDEPDLVHRGFLAFRRLVRWVRPRLMLHGHLHVYADLRPRDTWLDGCRVLNVYPSMLVELPEAELTRRPTAVSLGKDPGVAPRPTIESSKKDIG